MTEAPAVPNRVNLTLFQNDSMVNAWIASRRATQLEQLRALPPQEALDRLFAGLRRVLPTALVFFVPFLALGLKALYLRRKILYVDHLIFALHFQSALFLGLSATWLLCRLLGFALIPSLLMYAFAFLLILFVYMPQALHQVYRQRRRWPALKAVLLVFIYVQLLKLVGSMAALLVTSSMS